jgi:hypothetical protein
VRLAGITEDFYVTASNLRIFSTFDAVATVALLDHGAEGEFKLFSLATYELRPSRPPRSPVPFFSRL